MKTSKKGLDLIKRFRKYTGRNDLSGGAIDFGYNREINEMGLYSFRVGLGNESSGTAYSAFERFTTASGGYSTVFGGGSTASGKMFSFIKYL